MNLIVHTAMSRACDGDGRIGYCEPRVVRLSVINSIFDYYTMYMGKRVISLYI